MVAKNIYVVSEPIVTGAVTSSDVIAMCSVGIAACALFFSIYFADKQRRHNILVAAPHLEIDLGTITYYLKLTNHGPGVARIMKFTGTAEGKTYNFFRSDDVDAFIRWLLEDVTGEFHITQNIGTPGTCLAPNASLEVISNEIQLDAGDKVRLTKKLAITKYSLSALSIYGKAYEETYSMPVADKTDTTTVQAHDASS